MLTCVNLLINMSISILRWYQFSLLIISPNFILLLFIFIIELATIKKEILC